MKNAKRLRRSLLDEIANTLHWQAVAAERCSELYERIIELQERQLELSEKSVRAAQEIAHITKQNYADRLLAEARQATLLDEAP